jgi:hypothetical protein
MLLSEMIRNIRNDVSLISDSATYSTTSSSYTSLKSYNLSLSQNSIILYAYDIYTNVVDNYANVRLNINGNCVGGEAVTGTTVTRKAGIFYLPAGSYTINIEAKVSTGFGYVKNIVFEVVPLSEFTGVAPCSSGSVTVNLAVTRKLCVGTVKNVVIFVTAHNASSPTLTIDSVTYTMTRESSIHEKWFFAGVFSKGVNHTVNVSAGYFSVVVSPWLLPSIDGEIFDLGFPQGSTLYMVLEPLWSNTTKYFKVGAPRPANLGSSTDYYYTASGTDILSASYTFEMLEVEKTSVYLNGVGGCISAIAVDVR